MPTLRNAALLCLVTCAVVPAQAHGWAYTGEPDGEGITPYREVVSPGAPLTRLAGPTARGTVLDVDRRGTLVLSGPVVAADAADREEDGPEQRHESVKGLQERLDAGDDADAVGEIQGPAVAIVAAARYATAEVTYADNTTSPRVPLTEPAAPITAEREGPGGQPFTTTGMRVAVIDRAAGVPVRVRLRGPDGRTITVDSLRFGNPLLSEPVTVVDDAIGKVEAAVRALFGDPIPGQLERIAPYDTTFFRDPSGGGSTLIVTEPRALYPTLTLRSDRGASGSDRIPPVRYAGLAAPSVARVEFLALDGRQAAATPRSVPPLVGNVVSVLLPSEFEIERVRALNASGGVIGEIGRTKPEGRIGMPAIAAADLVTGPVSAPARFGARAAGTSFVALATKQHRCIATAARAVLTCKERPLNALRFQPEFRRVGAGRLITAILPASAARVELRQGVRSGVGARRRTRLRTTIVAPSVSPDGTRLLAVVVPLPRTAPGQEDPLRIVLRRADSRVLRVGSYPPDIYNDGVLDFGTLE